MGPASLFKKEGLLPEELYDHFAVYFVDLFESTKDGESVDYSSLTLNHFVEAIEEIRKQLDLEKMVLFGHSSNGVLALEYANQHPERVFFNILVGTMPIWGNYRKTLMSVFFKGNASEKRKEIDDASQSILQNSEVSPESSSMQKFVRQYKSRKAHFFSDDNLIQSQPAIDELWNGIHLDEDLVKRYFEVIADYDFRLTKDNNTPAFIALGLYDASCPLYAWTDDIKSWFARKNQSIVYDSLLKVHIFESDHYPMSPVFKDAKPSLFMEKLQKFMDIF